MNYNKNNPIANEVLRTPKFKLTGGQIKKRQSSFKRKKDYDVWWF